MRPRARLEPALRALVAAVLWILSPSREAVAAPEPPRTEAHRLSHLLAYLASDYPRAVADGRVVSFDELGEQLEIAEEADRLAARLSLLPTPDGPPVDLAGPVGAVRALVLDRAPAAAVTRAALAASEQVLAAFRVERAPRATPDRARGEALHAELCAPCHGADGRADTPLAASLEPRPASFHDPETAPDLSPYRVATTIRFGVLETAMPEFATLSDDERWDLAFHVVSLRHGAGSEVDGADFTLSELAARSDRELEDDLAKKGVPAAARDGAIATLRREAPFRLSPPAAPPGRAAWLALLAACAAVAVRLRPPSPARPAARGKRQAVFISALAAAVLAAALGARRCDLTAPRGGPERLTVRVLSTGTIREGTARLWAGGREHLVRFGRDNEATFELPPGSGEGASRLEILTAPELEPTWEPSRLFPLRGPVLEVRARPEPPPFRVVVLYRPEGGGVRSARAERFSPGEDTTVGVLAARAVAGIRITAPDIPAGVEYDALSPVSGRWLRATLPADHLGESERLVLLVDRRVRESLGPEPGAYTSFVTAR